MQHSPRFQSVNSKLLRSLRRKIGWSQAELGKRAGYCERVIRKAEAGGKLNLETIENIAQTFSSFAVPVTTQELIFSEELLARKFVESYDSAGQKMLDVCGDFLSTDFIFHVQAPRSIVNLAGVYNGTVEFQNFLDRFFSQFARVPTSLKAAYLTASSRVVACFDERLSFGGKQLPTIWVNLHFYYKDGLIARVDQQLDYLTALESIEAIQLKSILEPPRKD